MFKDEFNLTDDLGRNPSVYRLWQQARKEGGSQGDVEDRYRALLEEHGHRNEGTMKW